MELILWFVGYAFVGFVMGIFMTKVEYTVAIKNGEDALPHKINNLGNKYTVDELEKLETERRTNLANKAKRSGIVFGILWPIGMVLMIVLGMFKTFKVITHKIAIDPVDRDFVSEKQHRAAMKVVEAYDKQRKEEFDKQLES